MYLHIGNGVSVKEKDIIGIFDLDTSTVSKVTKKFVNKMSRNGDLEYTDSDLPRSFVFCSEGKKFKVKLSRISSLGLRQRIDGEFKGLGE
jgi:hypothetical protein